MSTHSDDDTFFTACNTPASTSDVQCFNYDNYEKPIRDTSYVLLDGSDDKRPPLTRLPPFFGVERSGVPLDRRSTNTDRLSTDGTNPWGLPPDSINTLVDSLSHRTEAWRRTVEDALQSSSGLPSLVNDSRPPSTSQRQGLASILITYVQHVDGMRRALDKLIDLVAIELQEAAVLGIETAVDAQGKGRHQSRTNSSSHKSGRSYTGSDVADSVPAKCARPHTPKAAEPTTTILTGALPRFSNASSLDELPEADNETSKPSMTTLLTPQNVTAISWQNPPEPVGSPIPTPRDTVSLHGLSDPEDLHLRDEVLPDATPKRFGTPHTPPQTPTSAFAAGPRKLQRRKSESTATDFRAQKLTSILKSENRQSDLAAPRPVRRPRFILPFSDSDSDASRESSPPVVSEFKSTKGRRPTMYKLGIDAHFPLDDDEDEDEQEDGPENSQPATPLPVTHMTIISSARPYVASANPDALSSERIPSRTASLNGTSSSGHRRRSSSQIRAFQPARPGSFQHPGSPPPPRPPADDDNDVIISLGHSGAVPEEAQRRLSSIERMRKILNRYPPLPKPDQIGIYAALTGARRPSNGATKTDDNKKNGHEGEEQAPAVSGDGSLSPGSEDGGLLRPCSCGDEMGVHTPASGGSMHR